MRKPMSGRIVWQDLTVKDAEKVKDFYKAVVGWESSPVLMGDYDDYNMMVDNEPVAGVCHAKGSNSNLPPQWLLYVNVKDVEKSVEQCIENGGKVIDGPRQFGKQTFYVIQDPAGAYMGIIS